MDYLFFFLLDKILKLGHLDVFLLNLLAMSLILVLSSVQQSKTVFFASLYSTPVAAHTRTHPHTLQLDFVFNNRSCKEKHVEISILHMNTHLKAGFSTE